MALFARVARFARTSPIYENQVTDGTDGCGRDSDFIDILLNFKIISNFHFMQLKSTDKRQNLHKQKKSKYFPFNEKNKVTDGTQSKTKNFVSF